MMLVQNRDRIDPVITQCALLVFTTPALANICFRKLTVVVAKEICNAIVVGMTTLSSSLILNPLVTYVRHVSHILLTSHRLDHDGCASNHLLPRSHLVQLRMISNGISKRDDQLRRVACFLEFSTGNCYNQTQGRKQSQPHPQ